MRSFGLICSSDAKFTAIVPILPLCASFASFCDLKVFTITPNVFLRLSRGIFF